MLMVLLSVDFNNRLFHTVVWALVALLVFHHSLVVHPSAVVLHLVV